MTRVWRVEAGAATDVGQVRRLNEDGFFAGRRVFLVADGMGGHAAGDVASSLTLDVLSALDDELVTREGIRNAISRANEAVLAYAAAHPDTRGMGTTVAGVAMVADPPGHWVIFHVGDSRVYSLEGSELTQLTIDHSEVAELVGAGVITPEEAATHPARNVITRAVGEWPPPDADMVLIPSRPGRRLMICSDGLTGEIEDEEIAAFLASPRPADEAATALVRAAVDHGGRDNVTVVVIDEAPGADEQPVVHTTVPRHQSGGR
ncbi:MAG: serine/threonine-protein phosphatase [Actinomycetales bacterium]|nr:serine/threonine-protein phosphatase [Candidatus Lutibacillus vidarii]